MYVRTTKTNVKKADWEMGFDEGFQGLPRAGDGVARALFEVGGRRA